MKFDLEGTHLSAFNLDTYLQLCQVHLLTHQSRTTPCQLLLLILLLYAFLHSLFPLFVFRFTPLAFSKHAFLSLCLADKRLGPATFAYHLTYRML